MVQYANPDQRLEEGSQRGRNALRSYMDAYPKALTQAQWAERFGMSRTVLVMILNGKRRPSDNAKVLIAKATNGVVAESSWYG